MFIGTWQWGRIILPRTKNCKFFATCSIWSYCKSLSSHFYQPTHLYYKNLASQRRVLSNALCRRFASVSQDSVVSVEEQVNYTWVPVYRFKNIHIGSIIARLKLAQTVIAAAIVPYFFWKYSLGEVPVEHCMIVSGLAVFAVGMLVVATRYFNRLIGVISMTDTNELVRVGYLSFWGSRRNQVMNLDDVVPVSDTDSNQNDVIVKFCRYSTPKFLYLSRVKSEILDEERAEILFGDLTIFKDIKKKGASSKDVKKKDL